jgi:hypothetical protein
LAYYYRTKENDEVKKLLLENMISYWIDNKPTNKKVELENEMKKLKLKIQALFESLKSTKFTPKHGATYGRMHMELMKLEKKKKV